MRLAALTTLCGILLAAPAVAQDGSFSASVDKNPVGVGDQFTLTLSLNNAGMGGKNLQLPDLSKFRIMSGPNSSSSMQIVNGAVSSSVSYSYVLQPKEIGKFTIGVASIEAGGKTLHSDPITIEIVKGSPRPPPQQQQHPAADLSSQIGDNLFLRASVDRSHVMQGDQINLTFKLYVGRVNVSNYTVDKNPTMTGFWSEDIENPKNIELTSEVVNGKQYRVGVIRRVALFPTQSGSLEISAMEVQTTLQVQSRSLDPFDAFFRDPFGRTVNYTVKSEPIKVRVDPLPPGAPAGFKGAVGVFTMTAGVDKNRATTNEPISFKIRVAGTGNVKLLESPGVEIPSDFEQYTPKVTDNITRSGGRISGAKTFEYLLIPRYPGQKTIKPVTFVYYDLGKRSYQTLRSDPIALTIDQGAGGSSPLVMGGERGDVKVLSQDIRYIKLGGIALMRRGEFLYASTSFLVMVFLPLAGLAAILVYRRKHEAVMRDEAGYRNRRAIKIAKKGLRQAEVLLKNKSALSSDQKLAFYAEVSRALWKYIGDKLNIPPSGWSIDGTLAELAKRSVNGEVATSLRSLLETCEMARFAPTSLEPSAMQQVYDDAEKMIIDLERTLRK